MKKISVVFLSLLVIFLITGCGKTEKDAKEESKEKEQTLVCTMNENEEGMDAEEVISMTYKNDKLKRMQMSVNFKITDPSIQENWEAFKESMDENNQEFNKDGISLKVDIDDQNYEYKTTLDIDVENVTEEALKEQGFEDLKDDNSTLEDSKKEAEADGATCIIK